MSFVVPRSCLLLKHKRNSTVQNVLCSSGLMSAPKFYHSVCARNTVGSVVFWHSLLFFHLHETSKNKQISPPSLSRSWPGSCSVIHSKQFFPVSCILIWQHYRLYSSPLSVISETIIYRAVGEFSDLFMSPYKRGKQLNCYSFMKHKCSLMRGVMILFLIKQVSFWVGLVTLFLLCLIQFSKTFFVPKWNLKKTLAVTPVFVFIYVFEIVAAQNSLSIYHWIRYFSVLHRLNIFLHF